MVSVRCKMVVEAELQKLNIPFKSVDIGSVELESKLTAEQQKKLALILLKCGLELVDDKKSILIEKVKQTIIEIVYEFDEPLKTNFSTYLSEKLSYDYTYLSNIFSEITAVSIEN